MGRAKKEIIDKSALTLQVQSLYEQAQKQLYEFAEPCYYFENAKALGRREAYGEVLKLIGWDERDLQAFVDEINISMGEPPEHKKQTDKRC